MSKQSLSKEIEEYLEHGGKITTVAPANKQLTPLQKKSKPRQPTRQHDPLCESCHHKKTCKEPCWPITWIDGNTARKETLLNDPIDTYDLPDYNDTLHKLIRSKQIDHLDDIKAIQNKRTRAIAAMLYADLSVNDISTILNLSRVHIYRLCNVTDKEEDFTI